jgi:hypothetical protein
MSKITTIPQAGRLARTMASDIAIYNEKKIEKGIQEDTLWELLADDLREGQKDWESRVSEDIARGTNLLEKALVDIIFAQHGNKPSKIF